MLAMRESKKSLDRKPDREKADRNKKALTPRVRARDYL